MGKRVSTLRQIYRREPKAYDAATKEDGSSNAGSHNGFGLRANDHKPAGKWIERFEEWLADSGFLKKP